MVYYSDDELRRKLKHLRGEESLRSNPVIGHDEGREVGGSFVAGVTSIPMTGLGKDFLARIAKESWRQPRCVEGAEYGWAVINLDPFDADLYVTNDPDLVEGVHNLMNSSFEGRVRLVDIYLMSGISEGELVPLALVPSLLEVQFTEVYWGDAVKRKGTARVRIQQSSLSWPGG